MAYSIVFVRYNRARFVAAAEVNRRSAENGAAAGNIFLAGRTDTKPGDCFKVVAAEATQNLPYVKILRHLSADAHFN